MSAKLKELLKLEIPPEGPRFGVWRIPKKDTTCKSK
jgi:hypothetical protein